MNQHARLEDKAIPFIDVAAQRRRLGRAIDDAIARVLAHCQFIQGPEVRALEAELAAFCGARHAIGCSSGTDALRLVLMAWGIGPGDAVICPAFTFCATAEVVALCGATPVIADVEAETFNLDPASCDRAVATAKRLGLKPRGDHSGRPVRPARGSRCDRRRSPPRTACSCLTTRRRRSARATRAAGSALFAPATATSFFPAKPLGCYGDGGAIFTDDDALAARLKSLRVHGEGGDKYDAEHIGLTGRLDTMQAAIVLEKLKIFPDEIAARNAAAARYAAGLAGVAIVPQRRPSMTSVWAQYTIRLAPGRRDALAAALKAAGHSDGDLLRQAAAPAGGLSALPGGRGRRAGERAAGRGSDQPAHARLSRASRCRIGSSPPSRARWRLRARAFPRKRESSRTRVAACGTSGPRFAGER